MGKLLRMGGQTLVVCICLMLLCCSKLRADDACRAGDVGCERSSGASSGGESDSSGSGSDRSGRDSGISTRGGSDSRERGEERTHWDFHNDTNGVGNITATAPDSSRSSIGRDGESSLSGSSILRDSVGSRDRGGPSGGGFSRDTISQRGLQGPRSPFRSDALTYTQLQVGKALNESLIERMQQQMNGPCFTGPCIRPATAQEMKPVSPYSMLNPGTTVCYGAIASPTPFANTGVMTCVTDGKPEICTFYGVTPPGLWSATLTSCPMTQSESLCIGIGPSNGISSASAEICFERTPNSNSVRFGGSANYGSGAVGFSAPAPSLLQWSR